MQEIDWDDLRYALAVSRTGRPAKAAQQLRVNETTVARRIARLEAALGARLFERINGALTVTEIGAAVVAQAERVEMNVGAVLNTAGGADAKAAGAVLLTAIPMVLKHMLMPALPGLLAAHPLLEMHLIAEPRNLSLANREADIALRFGPPSHEYRAIARRVCDIDYAVYGPAGQPADHLPWIAYETPQSALPHGKWLADALKSDRQAKPPVMVNDSDIALHAVRAGIGRSLIPCRIGDAEQGMARLSGPAPILSRELWMLVHPDLKHLARIRAVIDWIGRALADGGR